MSTKIAIGPDGGFWSESGPLETPVGVMVRFSVPTLHGTGKMAGRVVRTLPDGRLEVRAQLGGYYTINAEETL